MEKRKTDSGYWMKSRVSNLGLSEGVAEDREAGVPVDVKENGIGGAAADSEPVPDILKNEH